MALLIGTSDTEAQTTVGSGFAYSGAKMSVLGASEYVIAQMLIDWSSSVSGCRQGLIDCAKMVLEACKKHPKSENILLRVVTFDGRNGNIEIHGFMPINAVDSAVYDNMGHPTSTTPLMDAHLEALEALHDYGTNLVKNQFNCNAVLFVLSDGGENSSRTPDAMKKIVDMSAKIRSGDPIESFTQIMIGFNDLSSKADLLQYVKDATIDEYKSIGDATPTNIAKMGKFISHSFSTASVALGGGNSQQLTSAIQSVTF